MKQKKDTKKKAHKAKYSNMADSRRFVLKNNSSFYLREAYKSLRTNASFSLTDVEGCRSLPLPLLCREKARA